jgi:elongator complex protein 3
MKNLLAEIITKSLGKVSDQDELRKIMKKVCSGRADSFPSKIKLRKVYNKLVGEGKIKKDSKLEKVLVKRKVRSISGVSPVAIFTKPNDCPGNCHFCPSQENIPKSYLDNEPAVMRAIRNNYDPILQVWDRLEALRLAGHPTSKIELIVMGGSCSSYSGNYLLGYFKKIFWAANNYQPGIDKSKIVKYKEEQTITALQKKNEEASSRLIGISVETRPDLINLKDLKFWRKLGVTRVEIGVQTLDEEVLAYVNRGHGIKEVVESTKLLKDNGFKVIYHLMPGLPGSNFAKDKKVFKEIFTDSRFKPDQIKIYPCVVTKGAKIYDWYKKGKFRPYSEEQLTKYLIELKKKVPYWVRIIRVIRDIPSTSIEAGNKRNNLRQLLKQKMDKLKLKCNCIRCREAGDNKVKNEKLFIDEFSSSNGKEIFISSEDKNRELLYGILRLRLPSEDKKVTELLNDSAIVRELHTYGQSVEIGSINDNYVQHKGVGKRLMEAAEEYVRRKTDFEKIAVISGVGVRQYYRKLGYQLEDTYMIKSLT